MGRGIASNRKFTRIAGVNPSAISKAAKGDERLSMSVVYENGNSRIVIHDGCLEWHQHKNQRKDRSEKGSGVDIQGIMTRGVSSCIEGHYLALIRLATGDFRPASTLIPFSCQGFSQRRVFAGERTPETFPWVQLRCNTRVTAGSEPSWEEFLQEKTTSIQESVRIIGVDHAAASHATKGGKRLSTVCA